MKPRLFCLVALLALYVLGIESPAQEKKPKGQPELADWPLFRGDASRVAKGKGDIKSLVVQWQRSMFKESEDDVDTKETQRWVTDALKAQEKGVNVPTLPGFFPIAVDGTLIFRSYTSVTGVALKDIKDKGEVVIKAGEVEWKATVFPGSLGWILADKDVRYSIQTWLANYNKNRGHLPMVFENSQVGTMTSDSNNVYLVDDLAVPPPSNLKLNAGGPGEQVIKGMVRNLVAENTLYAFQLHLGKLCWQIPDSKKDHDEFKNSHFLGAPLPVAKHIYVLREKHNGEVRLDCIEPDQGIVKWIEKLTSVKEPYVGSLGRRIHATHLAYADGILVCPTNAGVVLGYDLAKRKTIWTYKYRDEKTKWASGSTDWKATAPILHDGKVVFTAPDSSDIYCLKLSDGKEVWKAQRKDDIYVGGVSGNKVLLVGSESCRALSLAKGKEVWKVDTGVPSGMGIASGEVYYLPVRAPKAGICVVDVAKGVVKKRINVPKEDPAPGNLLFYQGTLVSQTATELIVYASAGEKKEEK
jgi:outer membrane protein assembly factor BamB